MLPRISLRRTFLYLVLITGSLFLFVNVRQNNELWGRPALSPADSQPPPVPPPVHTAPPLPPLPPALAVDRIEQEQEHNRVANNEQEEDEFHEDAPEEDDINVAVDQSATPTPSGDADRPWYMSGGRRQPLPAARSRKTGQRVAKLWPHEQPGSDRITNQLMFVPPPPGQGLETGAGDDERVKKILVYNGLGSWGVKPGRDYFLQAKCPVDSCAITADKADAANVDAILYKDHFVSPGIVKPPKQVWILYFLECPYHTQHVKFNDVFNWTATYRRDSDIVAPYERWAYYDDRVKQKVHLDRNYAANKTKKVAWFVSNCGARNQRLQYAHELEKHISVDIYGACGTKKCPRSTANACLDMLDHDYKFYLAFENSNCKDYITEKFYVNGLGRNVLPIVMGARPEDYARNAPYRSYLHVDDFDSPRHLAEYLHRLDTDDELYNSYFRWKGTGEFINTYFFCRMCAMLHDDFPAKSYRDVNDWWRGPGTCTGGNWKKKSTTIKKASSGTFDTAAAAETAVIDRLALP